MPSKIRLLVDLDRKQYVNKMAQNLSVLRNLLGLTQTELADLIGVTRQTISSAECGARELSWTNFVSLLYIFTQNQVTLSYLESTEIYTSELSNIFQIANIARLQFDRAAADFKKKGR